MWVKTDQCQLSRLRTFVKNIVLDVVSMVLHEEAEELQDKPEDLDLDCIAV